MTTFIGKVVGNFGDKRRWREYEARVKELPETYRPTMTAIRVRGLEKSYGKLHVLRGVDVEVARGSIFALLGSNGAGKTTLVRILSTLLRADAGTAAVNGHDVGTQPARVRESVSLTGQFAAVDEILSGRENLVLAGLARFGVRGLTAAPPSLEELFMRHYGDASAALDRHERSAAVAR